MAKNYPRGQKELKKVFNVFNTQDTINWFEDRGVELVTQSDLCIFPKSQNSQTIIDCFLSEAKRLDIKIVIQRKLTQLKKVKNLFLLEFNNGEVKINSDSVILTIGGQPKLNGLSFLTEIGHTLAFPVPSLFTFNMPHETITELMGIVVEDVEVKIQSTKLVETGPLLITHWGMSGPSILKLSAWGARILYEKDYKFNVQIKWLKDFNFETLEQHLRAEITKHSNKKIINQKIVPLPSRLWQYLLNRIVFNTQKKWGELSKKEINKLVNVLLNDVYKVEGKTTFKEEFVTCGGVHLNEIDFKTMQSKIVKGLYFAGEVMDVDGITGGFNFQNAWSTAYVASRLN